MESITQTLLNELLAPAERSALESTSSRKTQFVHEKEEAEQDASDGEGTQVRYLLLHSYDYHDDSLLMC